MVDDDDDNKKHDKEKGLCLPANKTCGTKSMGAISNASFTSGAMHPTSIAAQ